MGRARSMSILIAMASLTSTMVALVGSTAETLESEWTMKDKLDFDVRIYGTVKREVY